MISRTLLCALVALAGVAFVASFTASDVCSVEIAVDYTDGDANDFKFTLSKDTTTSSAVLPPGTFTIGIKAFQCGDKSSQVAFEGTSTEQTITGSETEPKSVTVVSVDKEVLENDDASVEFPPVITSLEITPSSIKYGESVTLKATGRALPSGNPDSYTLTFAGSPGGTPSGTTCGEGASCELTYQAADPDNGNIEFEFAAIGGELTSTDNPKGYFLVDPNAEVSVDFKKAHKPVLDADEATYTPPSLRLSASQGDKLKIDLDVLDADLGTADGDTIELTVVVAKESFYGGADGNLQEISCGTTATATKGVAVTSGDNPHQPFTIEWDPSAALSNADWDDYGETACKFTITAKDDGNRVSQELTFVAIVAGTGVTSDGTGKKPQILSIIHETEVEAGASTSVLVRYEDKDDNVELKYTSSPSALNVDSSVEAKDCSSTVCSDTKAISIPSDVSGEQTLTVTVKDASGQEVTQDITITVSAAGGRRREAAAVPLLNTQFRFEDGKFIASLPDDVVSEMGSPTLAEEPEDAPQNPGNPPSNNNGTPVAAIAGGAAAGFVVIVGAVAAVVISQRRQAKAADMADRVSCSWDLTLSEDQQRGRRSTKWDKVELPAHESLP